MNTFPCLCGNTLFFDSTHCIQCNKSVGLCPECHQITTMAERPDGTQICGNVRCKLDVKRCDNGTQHNACNGFVRADREETLCEYCRLNAVIPDLSVSGNLDKWQKLEAAKRRVLFGVEALGFPIGSSANDAILPLTFAFKADDVEPVSTGHLDGCITVNLCEADEIQREKTRVEFGEPHRTLVGHFRHELGHYYWQALVKPKQLSAFRATFGNESQPTYEAARKQYYARGPVSGWSTDYISEYASMHPWEDFAETLGGYLDMAAVLSTARAFDLASVDCQDLDRMMAEYRRIGIAVNELNRDMGLIDLVPEVFSTSVVEKMRFIHKLRDA